MATYVNDLRLKEIATGDEAGTWGTSTNTNLELIGEALGYGTQDCFSSDADATTTVADGTTDPARAMYFKVTSSETLTATRTLTIAPNTISRVMFIENATTGSQSITISQGSGANVTIATGKTAVVYLDGAGSGAAVVDAFQDLSIPDLFIDDDLTFTSDSAVITFGADGDTTLTHTDGTGLTLNSTNKLTFGDVASFVQQSSDGVLRIDGEATIDLNASTAVTVSNDLKLDSDSAVLGFGADNDVTLTHVADTGLLLNSTMAIQFNDASQFINAPSATVLDINATDEIELNATLVDLNANLDVSGTYTGAGLMTTGGNIVIPDAGNIGSASDTNAIAIGADGDITLTQDLELQHDGAILSFGADNDTTLTHTDGSGLTLNSTNKIMFNDASQFIQGSSATVLSLGATDEIDLTATLIDINGNADVSGTVTATGTSVFASLDISGDIDVDGTTNLDVVDVDGAVNFGADVTFADGADIITASAGTSNFRAGVNAGNSITSGGNYNVVVGDEAGTAITTGDANTFVGFEAGKTISTASENTAFGYQALKANTSGDGNTAIGVKAMDANTVGDRNVAVGSDALGAMNPATNTDMYNVGVGYHAGLSVTTGTVNTLIGGLSGDALTTGNSNVAVGYATLSAGTGDAGVTAIGHNALKSLNSNSNNYNTAVGESAGEALTTGVQNVLIGGLAGDALTDADTNVAVGIGAIGSDTLGGSAVAIGSFALGSQNFTSATTNYNVAVGQQAGGSVTTGVQNVLIGGLAGDALTDADFNVAVGLAALSADTLGSRSTALGHGALENQNLNSATDTNNVAVGYVAGLSITTGTENTIVGASAADAMTTGSSNTFIGCTAAGTGVVTGDSNTAVGRSAGLNLTSGANNLFLGHDAGITGSPGGNIATGSDSIVLGDENIGDAYIQVDWTVASDARDKTDFTALDLGLEFVKDLKPVTYKWDKRSKYGDKYADDYDLNAQTPDGTHKEDWLDVGFKAQDVEALEIAAGYKIADKTNLTTSLTSDGKQMGLQYSKFVPILVKAIQEQQTLIDALTARIETLEG